MSLPAVASLRRATDRVRPVRVTSVAAVLITSVGFMVTLFSAISACPVNLAGGLLMVGASRPLRDAVHIDLDHPRPRHRPRLRHQPQWYAMAAVMLLVGSFLSVQSA